MAKKSAFNDLTPKEWTKLSRSVWTAQEISSAREKYHLEHGATFSQALAERAITLYTKHGDLVLDPFLGVGTTLIAAKKLGRRGIGIELYDKFAKTAKRILKQGSNHGSTPQQVVTGDCRNLQDWVQPDSVQLMFTSPPYANFIQRSLKDRQTTHKTSRLVMDNKSVVKPYGKNVADFGNLAYAPFLEEISSLMKTLYNVTKPRGYNIWVVKDYRNTKQGHPFIPFHSDIAQLGAKAGFKYHDLIIWDQNDQRSLVLLGYPSVFYVNINHTFLVVLRKLPRAQART